MANITQLAKTFNLTRQGIYKIDKANNFNLSSITDDKAKELLKEYINNKNKNVNYIANKLNISVTKARALTNKYNIIYADYETAEEIIEEINKGINKDLEEKEKIKQQIENEDYLITVFKTLQYLKKQKHNTFMMLLKCEKKKSQRTNGTERLTQQIEYLEHSIESLDNSINRLEQLIENKTAKEFNDAFKEYLHILYIRQTSRHRGV